MLTPSCLTFSEKKEESWASLNEKIVAALTEENKIEEEVVAACEYQLRIQEVLFGLSECLDEFDKKEEK